MDVKERLKLDLTVEEARNIVWGDHEDYETISDNIIDKRRWSIDCEIVVKRKSDGKFFRDNYSRAATEVQEEKPYEYSDPDFTEVFPVEKKVIVYE